MVASTVIAVFRAYSPIPFGDQWDVVLPKDYWQQLFDQHNEHRIMVPRLFFLVDLLLFDGTNVFNLASIFLIQLIHAAMLLWIGRRGGLTDGPQLCAAGGVVFSLLFWAYQIENFSWGFQVQFVGVYAAATAAFATLALAQRGWQSVLTAAALGAVAVYSMANGFLAPLLLTVLGFWLRLPWRQIAFLGTTATLLLALYLHGYHSPVGHTDPLDALHRFHIVLEYALCYLGGPFAQLILSSQRQPGTIIVPANVGLATAIGTIGILMFLTLLGTELRRRRPSQGVLLAIMAMVIATGIVTGMGRINFSLEQAFAQRYGTPSMIFWCASLLAVLSRRGEAPGTRVWLAISLVAAGLVGVAINQAAFLQYARDVGVFRRQAATAILAQSNDRADLEMLYPSLDLLLKRAQQLREAGLSVFSEDWAGWRGTNLAEHVEQITGDRCLGAVDLISLVPSDGPPAWRVSGWAVNMPERQVPRRLILTDGSGTVIGYAYSGHPRPDVRQVIPGLLSDRVGWRGHIQIAPDGVARAWLLANDSRSACPLPEKRWDGVPGSASLHRGAPHGEPVAMATVDIDGQWIERGISPAVAPLAADELTYGSWVRSDQDQGQLRWRTTSLPEGATLAIPVVAGPSSLGLKLRILDADNRAVLVDLGQVLAPDWQTLRLQLPSGTRSVEIEATDEGAGWGAWLAVGQPRFW